MPTYQNPTSETITYNDMTWTVNEIKPVDFFVPNEIGLTLTDENPRVDCPTLASGVFEFADETDPPRRLYVPDCCTFLASFIVRSGSVEIRENYSDNRAIPVSPENAFRVIAKRTEVEAFHIMPKEAAVVVFNVSRAG